MSTATMGDLDDISCKTCLQLSSFWLFLYQNSEYVSEKNLSNQSLLND